MEVILTSIIAFATTNIDDLFILTFFFSNKRYKSKEIYIGQFIGIVLLIMISWTGSLIEYVVPAAYIGLLGLLPIYLGIRKLIQLFPKGKDSNIEINPKPNASNVLSVATVTFANGGDNIGIYVPLFTTFSISEKSTMTAVFLVMTLIWCLVAQYLTTHTLVKNAVDKYGHIVTPIVLILLGVFIMYESGTLSLIR